MRLIDADALTDELIKGMEADTDKSIQATFAKSVCMILCKALEKQPTIDAVPVRHGKWIHEVRYTIDSLHSYQQYRCSECGMTYITHTKYCPNCGARMDGDRDEPIKRL